MTATNLALARFGAHVMDVIADYSHLPLLEFVGVNEQMHRVLVSVARRTNTDQAAGVAGWAKAFGGSITVDTVSGRIKAKLGVSDIVVRFDEAVNHEFAINLSTALGGPFPQLAVTADQMLTGLGVLAAQSSEGDPR